MIVWNRNFKGTEQEQISLYNQLGRATFSTPEKAIEYAEQSLLLAEKFNDKKAQGTALTTIGLANYYLAEYEKSISFF